MSPPPSEQEERKIVNLLAKSNDAETLVSALTNAADAINLNEAGALTKVEFNVRLKMAALLERADELDMTTDQQQCDFIMRDVLAIQELNQFPTLKAELTQLANQPRGTDLDETPNSRVTHAVCDPLYRELNPNYDG